MVIWMCLMSWYSAKGLEETRGIQLSKYNEKKATKPHYEKETAVSQCNILMILKMQFQ